MENLEKQVSDYLNFCTKRKKLDPKTLKAYLIDLKQFTAFISENGGGVNKTSLEKYVESFQEKYKPKTVKRKIACVKAMFNYFEYEDIIENNPFNRIQTKFREPFHLPKTIPLDKVCSILAAAYGQSNNTANTEYQTNLILRDIAVLELLFATGARVSELCTLKINDIDLTSGNIKIYGKGAKERLIQIGNSDVLAALQKYANVFSMQMSSSGYLFVNRFGKRLSEQSVRAIINKYAKMCNSPIHITPHMFRHTFATLLLEEDVDIRYIQKMLGHSSIVTTQIYTHVSTQKQKQILTDKHPRNKLLLNQG
jgi:integrase/recombinase XerD